MSITLQIKRGLSTNLPASAPVGELYYATDTNILYIGAGSGISELNNGVNLTLSESDIQGIAADATSASGINPILISGKGADGNQHDIKTDNTGIVAVNVQNFPGTQPVSGSVSVSNLPATQPVSGSVSVTSLPSVPAGSNLIGQVEVSDGTNILGTSAHPVKTDPTGTTTQPVSGTVSVSNFPATQPVSGSVSVSNFPATQAVSGFPAAQSVVGGGIEATAQRVTIASDSTGLLSVDDNGGSLTVDGTVAATQSGTWTVQPGNTANTTAWKVDGSAVTQPVQGAKTNNSAAPGTTNVGAIPVLANAAPPTWTEGNQVLHSADLAGNLRVYAHPMNLLGCYTVNSRTTTYSGLAAGTPLVSFRWANASNLAVILRVQVSVFTTVAATTAGITERELVIARSFTASDTGGTAISLTGNNNKRRTSQGTSLVTDLRFGSGISAGTRTLDANPFSSAVAWTGLNFTGLTIGGNGAAATAAAWSDTGGQGYVDLLNATNGQEYPIVLANNEGVIVRVGKDAQVTGTTQQTYVTITWAEMPSY